MTSSYEAVASLIRDEHTSHGSPYLVSINGGVAAGKSWVASHLRSLLNAPPADLAVAVVCSDGFLFPNAVLDRHGLSARKGFPETYDRERLITFLDAVRHRDPDAAAPVYSHLTYDVVDGASEPVGLPDLLIVEGLGLLQPEEVAACFDLSLYLEADEADLRGWFARRFSELLQEGASDEASFYYRFRSLDGAAVSGLADAVWDAVNGINLREHIIPSRERARVIVELDGDHDVRRVVFR